MIDSVKPLTYKRAETAQRAKSLAPQEPGGTYVDSQVLEDLWPRIPIFEECRVLHFELAPLVSHILALHEVRSSIHRLSESPQNVRDRSATRKLSDSSSGLSKGWEAHKLAKLDRLVEVLVPIVLSLVDRAVLDAARIVRRR